MKGKKVLINCRVVHCLQTKLVEEISAIQEIQKRLNYELVACRAEKKRLDRILKRQLSSENGVCAAPHCHIPCGYRKEVAS